LDTFAELELLLCRAVPDWKVFLDLKAIIDEADRRIYLDSGTISLPDNYSIHVTRRIFAVTFPRNELGTGFCVELVVGSKQQGDGEHQGIAVATLWYSEALKLITSDWDSADSI
jgi:hypothetical protein